MKPMEKAVEAVVRALGIDDVAVARRKVFLEFTDDDIARLRTLHEALQTQAPDFVNAFYTHLLAFEETRALLPDAQMLERLKCSHAAYVSGLTAGYYGREYIHHRLHVGVAHQRVGLAPEWYLCAYSKYLAGLLPEHSGSAGLGVTPRPLLPPARRSSRSSCWTWGLPSTPISRPTGNP